MKILILGGTVFVGRHLVEAATSRGHTVTLFNRGQHNPELFPQVEKLRGNRDGELAVLAGRQWDAVIDTCGYVPRLVHDAATALADQVDHYTFISTISVYPDYSQAGLDETAAVGTLPDPTVEEVTGERYGPLKALCEAAAEAAMPGRVLTIRPGLIVGPHDPTDRFTYWPVRVARGGAVLAPGEPSQAVQFIDVRDLAAWTIRMVEAKATGVYNATGPATTLPMQRFLAACNQVGGAQANLLWVDEPFLTEAKVGAFVELPLWVPAAMAGLEQINCGKAIAAGLTFRPLATTIGDTLTWHATRPTDHSWRAGLSATREAELLQAWQAKP
ncbi:MAG: NAD-dependent epimerase/dehydratase family protein [Caldilineaceae bacterium]|nr:NAD-dependent epimerase/dehydratase family protein [Caldilineaceae bacterium]